MSQDVSIAKLQQDIGAKLNAEAFFATINVQLERKELYSSELAMAAIWQTPTGGKQGVGVVVAMPDLNIEDAEAPGPELVCTQTLTVLEEPNVNQNPGTGTLIFAEDIGIYLIRLLHQFGLSQDITLYGRGRVMTPNRQHEGIRGVDVEFEYRFTPDELTKCATVPISFAEGQCTLTCATAGASIYYTVDGSFPGPGAQTAVVYQGPFAAASGTQIRAAAYAPGLAGSDVWSEVAP